MWALRRASNSIKSCALNKQTFLACGTRIEIASFCIEDDAESVEHLQVKSDRLSVSLNRLYRAPHDSPRSFIVSRRFLSSQAGKKSNDDEDDDCDFFKSNSDVNVKDSEQGLSDDDDDDDEDDDDDNDDDVEENNNEVELLDMETDASKKVSPKRAAFSPLFKNIIAAPGLSVSDVMDKWVEEGNDVSRPEIVQVMLGLHKHRMFGTALQLSEWLEKSKKIEFTDEDYASRLDLIAKVRGLEKAEKYIDSKIPKSLRNELIYETLIANCVKACNVNKTEQVFNKMKDLEFTKKPFVYNQLLLLYKKMDKKKIADVLLLMEKENVKPNLFTYKLLIDIKGQTRDIDGLDQIVETMIGEGIKPDVYTQVNMVRHYASAGLKEKAEAVLKQMEGNDLKENRWICRYLLPSYADVGKSVEVSRIWNVCKSNPSLEECTAAIESFGKLKKINDAEEVFDQMSKKWKRLSAKHYTVLLNVYANHKMLDKGKDLARKMTKSGCRIGPLTWDALVKLYVESGQVEKADSILYKATQQSKVKPMFYSFISIMNQYAKKGDIHNAEKMFDRMRKVGYVGAKQYEHLIKAYINAKKPAYGIRERMKADNVFPNKIIATQLPLVNAFRKNAISDLLD